MSSHEEDDIQDEVFEEYSDISSESDHYELEVVDNHRSSDHSHKIQQKQEVILDFQKQQLDFQKQQLEDNKPKIKIPFKTADDEDIIQMCTQIALKSNQSLISQRKKNKLKFKECQKNILASRSNLKDFDMPYQTAHFPLLLRTIDKSVLFPAQNLNIRKGTIESFIKLNLENENSVKKAEMDRRIAFKQRRPYQRRKFDVGQ